MKRRPEHRSPANFRFIRIAHSAGELIDNRRGAPEILASSELAFDARLWVRLGAAIAMFMQGTQKERHSPTAFAPWRTAVSRISMALMPNAPSPLDRDHLPAGKSEGGSDAEGHAHAEEQS